MKMIALLSISLLACIGATTAFAQGKVGDVCNFEGTLVGIGQPLICVDHVLQPAVTISVRAKVLDEHQHLVTEFHVAGPNGTPMPMSVTSASKVKGHPTTTEGKAYEGFSTIFTPRLLPSGDILLNYTVMQSRQVAFVSSIKLHSGREVSVPWGNDRIGTDVSNPRQSRYTIKFTASVLKN